MTARLADEIEYLVQTEANANANFLCGEEWQTGISQDTGLHANSGIGAFNHDPLTRRDFPQSRVHDTNVSRFAQKLSALAHRITRI